MQTRILPLGGQDAGVHMPTDSRREGRLVVFCHGAGWAWANHEPQVYSAAPALIKSIHLLNREGYAVVAPQLFDWSLFNILNPLYETAGHTFGNDVSTTLLDNVITDALAMDGIDSGAKVALVGVSMGNLTMLNYARRFGQTNLAGLLGIVPVASMEPFRGTDSAPVGAYGYVTVNKAHYQSDPNGPATVDDTRFNNDILPTYDGLSIAGSITVPYGLWGTSDDTSCPPADIAALAALVDPDILDHRNLGVGGHSPGAIKGDDLLEWLNHLTW